MAKTRKKLTRRSGQTELSMEVGGSDDAELLAELRTLNERLAIQNELLVILVRANCRTTQIVEHEHRLRYPKVTTQVNSPKAFADQVDAELKRIHRKVTDAE